MAIAAIFEIQGMTAEQYDRTVKDLEAAGLGAPDGRIDHISCNTGDGWWVVDHWESPEKMQKFAESLMPILEAAGVTPAEPRILPVHNIIRG